MNLSNQYICPKCHNTLKRTTSQEFCCESCDTAFPLIKGVTETREQEKVTALLEQYDQLSFVELIDYYAEHLSPSYLADNIRDYYRDYFKRAIERGKREFELIKDNMQQVGIDCARHRALDLGCGMGTGVAAAASEFDEVHGIDPSLWRLIIAQKFCGENGLSNIALACGYAEHLPFPATHFNLTWAINVLEHLDDPDQAMAEMARTLAPTGCFCGDSSNRFDLFTPEPHVDVRWVGFWPRFLASWYVERRKGMPYRGTRLLSYRELSRLLRRHFGARNYWILLRKLRGKQFKRLQSLWYSALRSPGLGDLLKLFAPLYDVVAVRTA
jgi:ubiquinone/menaquinone biosynthesis C-methylase UbiE